MSLNFGLNVKKSGPPPRKSIWDEPEDEEDDEPQTTDEPEQARGPVKKFGLNVPHSKVAGPPTHLSKARETQSQNAASTYAAKKQIKAAEELDPSIFDYDTFLDAKSSWNDAKKAAARQDAIERKPKYIDKLLDAAARRKQDQLVAQEKLLQREREAEGDDFADKEKFVTGAYKQQQEEARQLQEEERARAEADEERQRRLGGGMQSFYRSVMDQTEKSHQEAVEAAAKYDKSNKHATESVASKSDAEIAAEMKAKGVNVQVNEDGQLVDKRQLLSAGLNIVPSGKATNAGADHLKASARTQQTGFRRDVAADRAQGERQRKLIEEQMEASAKRKREEEEEQRAQQERDAKSRKTDQDVSDAKARYLARKAAKERGEG